MTVFGAAKAAWMFCISAPPAPQAWVGDLPPARFEERGDPQELAEAAAERRVGLRDVEGVLLGEDPPLGDAGQRLAAGDRDARRAAQLAVAPRVRVRQRLLEQEQVERFDRLDHGQGGRHLPAGDREVVLVAVEQDRHVRADVVADEGELLGLEVGRCGGLGERVLLAVGRRCAGADLEGAEAEPEVEVDLVGQAAARVDRPAAGRIAEQAVVASRRRAARGPAGPSSRPRRSQSAASIPVMTASPSPVRAQ